MATSPITRSGHPDCFHHNGHRQITASLGLNLTPRCRVAASNPPRRFTLSTRPNDTEVRSVASLALRSWTLGVAGMWHSIIEPRVVAALQLSFGMVALAALATAINVPFGLLTDGMPARYRFHGRNLAASLIDLPLAPPTAVARIAPTGLFASRGWIGVWLALIGIKTDQMCILAALIFVGLPYVVNGLEPVIMNLPNFPSAVLSTARRTVRPRSVDT